MSSPLILCSTPRLARSLRQAHARRQRLSGKSQWEALPVMTLSQWLNALVSEALLRGEMAADDVPAMVPGSLQERILWERAVETSLVGHVAEALFDTAGLAATAMEANRLMQTWRISLPTGEQTEETQQFLRWRSAFRKACAQSGWLEPARYLEWQIDQLEAGKGRLPQAIQLAGFDRLSPQEQRLCDVLATRGVDVSLWQTGAIDAVEAQQVMLPDQEAECRAVVAWAAQRLAENPDATLAIVTPDLAAVRARLAALLDDVLQPATLAAAASESVRRYDFSLGVPLSSVPLVGAALGLLRLLSKRQQVEQRAMSSLLLQPYWSHGLYEADGRALLDGAMRQKLPMFFSMERFLRFVQRQAEQGMRTQALADALENMAALMQRQAARQMPSAWITLFRQLLGAAAWPGDRSLSSHEFQAREAFHETLDTLRELDGLLGKLSMAEAVRYLTQACREQIFQPRSLGNPNITIMGMLESLGEPVEAMWVMGMNDHLWPPPPRPNPLLPVMAQRSARAPNADNGVQNDFALAIHGRLMRSARTVIFSHAHQEGDRELRPSPLIADLPRMTDTPLAMTMAETLAAMPGQRELVEDHQAPAVEEGERVRGGARLLKAQAVCPAWAYYQFRLGAIKLAEPVEGLDAAGRGTLLHAALECFWAGRDSAALAALDEAALDAAVAVAVEQAVTQFNAERDEALPPGFLALEAERLHKVVMGWVRFEKTRETPFTVFACEQEQTLEVEGISVKLVMDRVDRLDDGGVVVVDYKTGAALDIKNWATDRMTEPQLPIYASLALSGERVVAVAFARVRSDDPRYVGLSATEGVLPGVSTLGDAKVRKEFTEARFPDWDALLEHWRQRVAAIAREVRAGEAAVTFTNEADLAYCEVVPLLRLPERQLLLESQRSE